jgi:plastocyanin
MATPREVLMLGRRRKALAGALIAAAMLVVALAVTATVGAAGGHKLSLRAAASGAPKFNKKTLRVKPGKATVTLTNPSGSGSKHAVEVEGHGIEKESKTIGPGKKASVTVRLRVGTYTFYCPVDGHKAAGMKGKIVVKR